MEIPKYIVVRVDVMRKGTSVELTNITDEVEDVIFKADRKTESNSEKPNNCEHITEDGVTCAKYPACDDCLDNPLNKVKGSERLVKGKDEPQTEPLQTCSVNGRPYTDCCNCEYFKCTADEPQTDCAWREPCGK